MLPVGFGCMRLSTEASRDDERSRQVIAAAIAAGADLLDTADAYARDESERGHNERLIAEVARASGRSVRIATKGGLTRPGGSWVPDGRAAHLLEACEASLRALGTERIDLYQLHAPDPRTPFATSVRALARIVREGLAASIGLCNVSASQLEEALELAPIRSVQIALSPLDERAWRGGVPELCRERGVLLLAHSPLGGPKRAGRIGRDPVLARLAAERGKSAQALVLAWLRDLGVVPLPGATRDDHAREVASLSSLVLDEDARRAIDARFPLAALALREPRAKRRPAGARGEVVILMGMPAAGKSTLVQRYVERGYERWNRDERGGTLSKLAKALEASLAAGTTHAVLDNTYASRASRHEVIEAAWRHRLAVRCVWLDTPIERAQVNAVGRMLARYGRLLEPSEMARLGKKDPSVFDPRAQYRWQRELEPPAESEGFSAIERVAFEARGTPAGGAATIVSLDALLAKSGALEPARAAVLREQRGLVLATAWNPPGREVDLDGVRHTLGFELEIATCIHPAGPPICWCRKPLPGLALVLIARHGLDPARTTWVGASAADRALARNVGMLYEPASLFFARGGRELA